MPIRTESGLKLTYDDYVRIPEDGLRHEILDGAHYVNASPTPYHQDLSRRIQFQLYVQIEQSGRGRVYNAPVDVHLSDTDIAVPDLAVVATGGAARVGPVRIEGPPELLVEILSPSTAPVDRGVKRDRYARAGVREYWIVDPKAHVVEQWVLDGDRFRRVTAATASLTPVTFPEVTVDLTEVW